jgi:hypothetical protein
VKSGATTDKLTFVVWVRVPSVPVTVTGYVPGVTDPVVVNVSVEVPVPVTLDGLNPALTPDGNPLAPSPTVPLYPFTAVTFTVYVPLLPDVTLWLDGVAPIVKSGVATPPDNVAACNVTFPLDVLFVYLTLSVCPAPPAR